MTHLGLSIRTIAMASSLWDRCLKSHATPSGRAVRKSNAPEGTTEEPSQVAGTLEVPYAGVDYYRDDIVREIRYGELVKYDPNTDTFRVVTKKHYDPAEAQYGEWQREVFPAGGPSPSNVNATTGNPRVDARYARTEVLPAWRVFQLWSPPFQAGMFACVDPMPTHATRVIVPPDIIAPAPSTAATRSPTALV